MTENSNIHFHSTVVSLVNFHYPQPLRKEIPKSHKSIPFGHPCSGSQSTVPHGHLSLQPCPKYPDEQTPLEQLMP